MIELQRRQIMVLAVAAAVILFGAGYKYARLQEAKADALDLKPVPEQLGEAPRQEPPEEIVVHITGAVQNPGLYRLTQGARVADAIELAAPEPGADLDYLNLAAVLSDQYKLVVPDRETTARLQAQGGNAPAGQLAGYGGGINGTNPRVNINTAGQAELETLPGIGPSLAQRIIQHRQDKGPFGATEDIRGVSGIGDKRYEQLKDLISVN